MKLFRELTKKPWLTPGVDAEADRGAAALRRPAIVSTGVWLYVCVATVMFSLIVVAYILRLGNYGADPEKAAEATSSLAWWSLAALCGIPPAEDWRPLSEPWLLWGNTAVLILSSAAWQRARNQLRLERMDKARTALIAGGVLAFGFLAGQLTVWRQLMADGYFATASPANAFFYLITAVHGLHLLGGLIFWGRTAARVTHGANAAEVETGVKLCAVYWHYLLLVWVVIFGLLLIT
ncbi:MAG: heme-copper oxidase subunit III [Parvularculaceae bacterium]